MVVVAACKVGVKKMDFLGSSSNAKDSAGVNETGSVLPVSFSHNSNVVGIHWLRISFQTKHLGMASEFLTHIWGDFDQDGYGLWSYDSRFHWDSGVSLNYDQDKDRSDRVHCGQATLDCPGSALDELAAGDLETIIEYFELLGGKCTRIDVYFDDYSRTVTPEQVYIAAKRGDYSGFRTYGRRERGDQNGVTYDETSFGRRGSYGNGCYLRFYDKYLESNGEQNCCRWEIEFTQKKADAVFKKIAQCGTDIQAFATLCGSLIAGCVTFIHRTGEKNISRLQKYEWWEKILDILGGTVKIRVKRKKDSVLGKMEWIEHNVTPSLACLKRVFINDESFFRWLFDVIHEGESRMNSFSEQIARENSQTLNYRWNHFIDPTNFGAV